MDIVCHVPVWNEEFMLPYFFKHYDFVSRFIIYDNGSTDGTKDLVKSNPKAELVDWDTGEQLNNAALVRLKNNCWMDLRSEWVIVCDVDEFLLVDLDVLSQYKNQTVAFQSIGWNMVGFNEPFADIDHAVRSKWFDKIVLFKGDVKEINYQPGAHTAMPECRIINQFDLRHYNALSEKHMINRWHRYRSRRSESDKKKSYGYHYEWPEERVKAEFQRMKNSMVRVPSLKELFPEKWI